MKSARFCLAALVCACFALSMTLGPTPAAYAGDPPACPGDANGDGQTGIFDLIAVLMDFGQVCDPDPCDTDVDDSGAVDIDDIIVVILDLGCGLTPCESNADCEDGDPYTKDICAAGHCLNLAIPNCK